ncbi:MAG TPA: UDP-galactopyranose mutase [Segetibacter sp.]|nr:UDP-galactopyranose mutase [Segetibacter sp.]
MEVTNGIFKTNNGYQLDGASNNPSTLICFSHLRWNFVYQRPQHLLSRFATIYTVYFVEEPFHDAQGEPTLSFTPKSDNLWIVTPHLPARISQEETERLQKNLLDKFLKSKNLDDLIFWYYTPMALAFSGHIKPALTIYDCMDELSHFKNAPARLTDFENDLFKKADIVFTGGQCLYEYKKDKHKNIYAFPSSIDKKHFEQARTVKEEPVDQKNIKGPKLGFYGVIDERFDIELIKNMAELRPEWNFVLLGPVVKINPNSLPHQPNVHLLGGKNYDELPKYVSGWDVALIPFAINESTRFISPTKTPEYLAAGVPVVSTPITDVINPYGDKGLVKIGSTAEEFIAAAEDYMMMNKENWMPEVDEFLADKSWSSTFMEMMKKINATLASQKKNKTVARTSEKYTYDYLIVGAGFAGSVLAERLASVGNKKILIIDKRNHIGGNAYDYYNEDGVLVHKYGPHIFHTNSADVFNYLSKFTGWRNYQHKVLANVDGQLLPIPINLNTINKYYGLNLNGLEVEEFLASRAEKTYPIKTSEDVVVSKVGRELYEKFFRGYTRKQWDLDPSELDASVTARVPTRTNKDDRYFTDTYQSMPSHGYTKMFEKMLSHPNIKIMLNTDYEEVMDDVKFRKLIFTGPVDEFFNYRYGKLPYRSLRFKFETMETAQFQETGTINYPNDYGFTRITEFKHLTGQKHDKTTLVYEFPEATGDPYYPVPRPENEMLYKKYAALANQLTNTYFVGRLATYRYYNMDQVVAQALTMFKKIMQSDLSTKLQSDEERVYQKQN